MWRAHLLAAIAAQNVLARDDMAPAIDHDLEYRGGHDSDQLSPTDGPFGARKLSLYPGPGCVRIDIASGIDVMAPLVDVTKYPNPDCVLPTGAEQQTILNGDHIFSPEYLGWVEEVNTATGCRNSGVTVERVSRFDPGSKVGGQPILLSNKRGVRFLIMPMRRT